MQFVGHELRGELVGATYQRMRVSLGSSKQRLMTLLLAASAVLGTRRDITAKANHYAVVLGID